MTIEDETGIANAVVWPKVLERYRKTVIGARLVLIRGRIQRHEEIIHVVAGRLEDRSAWLLALADGTHGISLRRLRAPTRCAAPRPAPGIPRATPVRNSASSQRAGIFISALAPAYGLAKITPYLAGHGYNSQAPPADGATLFGRVLRHSGLGASGLTTRTRATNGPGAGSSRARRPKPPPAPANTRTRTRQ